MFKNNVDFKQFFTQNFCYAHDISDTTRILLFMDVHNMLTVSCVRQSDSNNDLLPSHGSFVIRGNNIIIPTSMCTYIHVYRNYCFL